MLLLRQLFIQFSCEGLTLVPGQSIWDLRRTKWQWVRVFSEHVCYPLAVTISPLLHIPLSSGAGTIGPIETAALRNLDSQLSNLSNSDADTVEILIIWHFSKIVQGLEVLQKGHKECL